MAGRTRKSASALPRIVCVVGPTASGKTALGIRLAKLHQGEIINADSRQIYKGFDIGTGKPEGKRGIHQGHRAFLAGGIPHHLMDFLKPTEAFTAPEWRDAALKTVRSTARRERLPIVVGGTGLYIRSLVDNYTFPKLEPNVHFREAMATKPLSELVTLLLNLDPDAEQDVDLKNPRRVIRALEVATFTGKPFSKQKGLGEPLVEAFQVAIHHSREKLYERNDRTVDKMLKAGWVDEIREALKKGVSDQAPAMTSIGYRDLLRYVRGELSLADATALLKRSVRRYSKRQLTWFMKDKRIRWAKDEDEAVELVSEWLGETS